MLWLDCRIRVWRENGLKAVAFSLLNSKCEHPLAMHDWIFVFILTELGWLRHHHSNQGNVKHIQEKLPTICHLKPNYNCNHWVSPMPKIKFSHLPRKFFNIANIEYYLNGTTPLQLQSPSYYLTNATIIMSEYVDLSSQTNLMNSHPLSHHLHFCIIRTIFSFFQSP